MGIGHREYRVVDPRSRIIRALAQQAAKQPRHVKLLDVLSAVEEAFIDQTSAKSRALRANLEFCKGVVYLALDIPKECFTASFAAARIFGWIAHVTEQRQDNRIIGPAAHYVGPAPRKPSPWPSPDGRGGRHPHRSLWERSHEVRVRGASERQGALVRLHTRWL